MATRIDQIQHYPADPVTVFTMLSDEEYIVHKCLEAQAKDATAEVTQNGDGYTIHNSRVLPAKIPGFAKKFVGEQIPLDETQHWAPAAGDGSRDATFKVDFHGQPLGFEGTIELRPDGQETVVTTVGSIKCTVPLLGGKIEHLALDWIDKYLDKEERVGVAWLQRDG